MDWIKLNRTEKQLMICLRNEIDYRKILPPREFEAAVYSLEDKGLVNPVKDKGGIRAVFLTDKGRAYLVENPKLKNPVDYRWLIGTVSIPILIAIIDYLSKH